MTTTTASGWPLPCSTKTLCSIPLSLTRKSLAWRSVSGSPEEDRTNAGTITNSEVERIVGLDASVEEKLVCAEVARNARERLARYRANLRRLNVATHAPEPYNCREPIVEVKPCRIYAASPSWRNQAITRIDPCYDSGGFRPASSLRRLTCAWWLSFA